MYGFRNDSNKETEDTIKIDASRTSEMKAPRSRGASAIVSFVRDLSLR